MKGDPRGHFVYNVLAWLFAMLPLTLIWIPTPPAGRMPVIDAQTCGARIAIARLTFGPAAAAAAETIDSATARQWIDEMKSRHRGPFLRLRWFCQDGAILPPDQGCSAHGGGIQHGQWSEKTRQLRKAGYFIANVVADIDPEAFLSQADARRRLTHLLLEKYLIRVDDGWIFRQSRYYRGSLQAEDEALGGRKLLLAMAGRPEWRTDLFPLFREAARLIPHGAETKPVTEMRQKSLELAEKDPAFEPIRIKIHVLPEPSDADAVRTHASRKGKPRLAGEYRALAEAIDAVFAVSDLGGAAKKTLSELSDREVAAALSSWVSRLDETSGAAARAGAACRLMSAIRVALAQARSPADALALMDLSLDLESGIFSQGGAWLADTRLMDRSRRLDAVADGIAGAHGMGFIGGRAMGALSESLRRLTADPAAAVYRREAEYVSRLSAWSQGSLGFYFSIPMRTLSVIAPEARNFIHDRLHGSPLLTTAEMIDALAADARRISGVESRLFGESAGGGMRALNPGLARGILRAAPEGTDLSSLRPDGIYLLPATTRDLPPVAGILTEGRGNALSHVQLLARNLGIPNVAVDRRLWPRLRERAGESVVLAASPGGVARLMADSPEWDAVFSEGAGRPAEGDGEGLIRPDMDKLDLSRTEPIALSGLRARDSGVIAGPKAANLGELQHHFPEAVAPGIAIPFGVYRRMLDLPMDPGRPEGPSIWQWMSARYAEMAQGRSGDEDFIDGFLSLLRDRIAGLRLPPEYRGPLTAAMARAFGPDGSYGVFVRSDTNVEDLPGFTGAGLNLTVPHVMGVDNILAAVPMVWASPFEKRAFQWRQARMTDPSAVFVSVLLMKSVPVDKSGVLVTTDLETSDPGWLSVAVNEGPGGAVAGQNAEELRIDMETGRIRLMTPAAEPTRLVLKPEGGVTRTRASGNDWILTPPEIDDLIQLSRQAPGRFPMLRNEAGDPVPADIEFGYVDGRLALFQIRPFLESRWARKNRYLVGLDAAMEEGGKRRVDLYAMPEAN